MKLQLPNVCLIAICGNKHGETIASMYKSMAKVDFGQVKLLTNIDISCTGIEVVNVGGLESWSKYNLFVVKELYKHFHTSHCLIVQHDSWVLEPECWEDDFLNYDIIGARGFSDGRNNYNGGFSLRSLNFQTAIATDDFIDVTSPEDEILCRLYRAYIEEKYGSVYCTDEIADKFAFELHEPTCKTFGFHNFHQQPYKPVVVVKRSGALGDVIMAEPVMEYFHKQGYRVSLDTQNENYGVYCQHYFPVIPKVHLHPKLEYIEIDLNMAYEISPTKPVLQSYFEMAGIKNEPLRNSRLHLRSGDNQKMFAKYALIHIDPTHEMPHRDIQGDIKWDKVVEFLEDKGYLVFQVGKNIKKQVAPYLNTMGLEFMMFVVKGADLLIGCDSGVSQVAVGFSVPSVIFFSSVNPVYRYNDFSRIEWLHTDCPSKEKEFCYHQVIGTTGQPCEFDKDFPPCSQFTTKQILNSIQLLWNKI